MKVGIDLGGSHIAIGVVNSKGRIIEKIEKRILESEKKEITKTIENYILENIKQLTKKYKITELGIAIPGTVTDNKIIKSVNLFSLILNMLLVFPNISLKYSKLK